jgi:amino acid adenylation domain-containing protein
VIVGSPTAGRQQTELSGLVGYFVNPIPVRAKFAPDTTFDALIDQLRQTVLAAFEHADYPLPLLIERMQLARDPSRSPLFQVMFILQKAPALGDIGLEALALGTGGARLELGGLQLESLALEQRIAQFDLTLTMGEADDRLAGTFEYNTNLFEVATVARLMARFKDLLAHLVADPQQPIAYLPLLTQPEQQQFAAWNDTWVPDLPPASLVELFERQVELTPDAIAVLLPEAGALGMAAPNEDHHAGRASLTYSELNARANKLARRLRKLGVGPEVCVGLCLDRSLELVVAIMGVLKAGGAYLPLDPDYPAERQIFMLRQARASSLLTQKRQLDTIDQSALANDALPLICLDRDWAYIADESAANLEQLSSPEHLACVIYTSGSTGQPKAVLLENRNLINLVHSFIKSYEPGTADRILPLTGIASASFVGEVLPMLCSGGALVLPDKEEFLDFQKLITVIAREHVTILSTVPALLAGINALSDHLKLRLLLSGGETLFSNEVDQLLGSATVVNGYGLTETTVCSTYYILKPTDIGSEAPIPIGKPLINNQIFILDKNMQRVPIGVSGELYIAGEGLARGYLGDPAATAERFVPNPFNSERLEMRDWTFRFARGRELGNASQPISSSDRLYRTGDLARYRPDGQIEFHGRNDHQVKIRGFRIELGEIEMCLSHHPAVAEAVVLAHELGQAGGNGAAPQDKRLIAYIVPSPSSVVTSRLSHAHENSAIHVHPTEGHGQLIANLRSFIQARLPDYMVPSAFVILTALPLTPNGKVDAQALPIPDSARPALTQAYVAPQGEAERRIAAVWQEVLGLEKVGVHDNFFELGGHSLLLVKAHTSLRTMFDRPLSLVDLFTYPTVSSLAQYLSEEQQASPVFEKIQALADKQLLARSRRQQRMRSAVRRGENTDE